MKINDMLLNQLKLQNKYGDKASESETTGRVVNGSKEYWSKDAQVNELLERYQVPKTETNQKGIEAYLQNNEGSREDKLETIEIAASNGVEMTESNLNSIHEAINSDFQLEESIEVLVVGGEDAEGMITEGDVKEMALPEDMKAEILKDIESGTPVMKALAKALGKAFGEAFLSKFSGKVDGDITVTIRITIEVIEIKYQQEGDQFDLKALMDQFSALIEAAKNGEGTLITSAADLLAALASLEDASQVAETVLDEGVEVPVMTLEDDEDEATVASDEDFMDEIAAWVSEALNSVDDVVQEMMASLNDSDTIKLYVVESVTVKMQTVAESFKTEQSAMLQLLDTVTSEEKSLTSDQVKAVLETVINKLDDVLMKSDIPLYTSMTMEKSLLKMTSDLQEAQQLLSKNDVAGAKAIVKHVTKELSEAVFKPSEQKIQAFALKQSEAFTQEDKSLQEKQVMQLQSYKQEGVSARSVLDLFRSLGLNHEYEVSEKLSQLKNFEKDVKIESNLKEVLYKLERDEKEESHKTVETLEKSLNNLTGQQLLNKQGQKNSQQTMFFNIPIVNEQEVKNMKLYVNSRDANNRLDWENCSLYFVVDLKQYGPTGIKVDIQDRGVSITVKNDDENLKDVIEPLLDNLGDMLEEVGLKAKNVNFLPLDDHKKFGRNMLKEQSVSEETTSQQTTYDAAQKGFDFRI